MLPGIDVVKFSPDGALLATGSHVADGTVGGIIDIFDVRYIEAAACPPYLWAATVASKGTCLDCWVD